MGQKKTLAFTVIMAVLIALFTLPVHSQTVPVSGDAIHVLVTESGGVGFWRTALKYVTLGLVQTPEVVQVNKPFQVAFDHDGVDTDGYHIKTTGTQVLTFTATKAQALVGTVGTMTITLNQRGSYSLTATAFNIDVESDPSVALALFAQMGKPKTPTNVRKGG